MSESATATKTVIFTREHKGGLLSSRIRVAHQLLYFDNDQTSKHLEVGVRHLIEWEIEGPPGSSLVVAKRYAGDEESGPVEIVNSSIRPTDNGRREDAKRFLA